MGVAKKDVYKKSGKLVILPKKILMSFAKLVSQNVETMNVASLILYYYQISLQRKRDFFSNVDVFEMARVVLKQIPVINNSESQIFLEGSRNNRRTIDSNRFYSMRFNPIQGPSERKERGRGRKSILHTDILAGI